MSEGLVRVARAIFEANSGKWRGETWEQAGGDVEHSSVREAYLREARAAVASMRDPTEEMVNAARRSAPYDQDVTITWPIMIDELLA